MDLQKCKLASLEFETTQSAFTRALKQHNLILMSIKHQTFSFTVAYRQTETLYKDYDGSITFKV